MRLERLCSMDRRYTGAFHLAPCRAGESGVRWGPGGPAWLSGSARWSNQPNRRGDGSMLPNTRRVITTAETAEVFFDLSDLVDP
jgi:hypothetical protein